MTYQDGVMLGTNVFLGSGQENSLDGFKNSATFAQRMRESTHRVLYTIANYSAAMNGVSPDTSVASAAWWWKILLIVLMAVTGAITAVFGTLFVWGEIREKKNR